MDWKPEVPFPVFRNQWEKRFIAAGAWREVEHSEEFAVSAAVYGLIRAEEKYKKERKEYRASIEIQQNWVEFACLRGNPRTFLFSKALLESLDLTDLRPTPSELVKIPFDTVYLDFSAHPIEVSSTEPDREDNAEMRGVFLTATEHAGSGLMLLGFRVSARPNDKKLADTLSKLLEEEKNTPPNSIAVMAVFHHKPSRGSPWGLSSTVLSPKDGVYQPSKEVLEYPADEIKAGGMILRRIFNGLLYINSVNADIREEWMREDLVPHLKGKSGRARRDLRDSIEREGKVHRAGYYISIPSVSPPSDPSNPGRTLDIRFLVRGHNHHYWTGSDRRGNKKLVLRWLYPYWKGPEMAEVVHKLYVVKPPPKKEE